MAPKSIGGGVTGSSETDLTAEEIQQRINEIQALRRVRDAYFLLSESMNHAAAPKAKATEEQKATLNTPPQPYSHVVEMVADMEESARLVGNYGRHTGDKHHQNAAKKLTHMAQELKQAFSVLEKTYMPIERTQETIPESVSLRTEVFSKHWEQLSLPVQMVKTLDEQLKGVEQELPALEKSLKTLQERTPEARIKACTKSLNALSNVETSLRKLPEKEKSGCMVDMKEIRTTSELARQIRTKLFNRPYIRDQMDTIIKCHEPERGLSSKDVTLENILFQERTWLPKQRKLPTEKEQEPESKVPLSQAVEFLRKEIEREKDQSENMVKQAKQKNKKEEVPTRLTQASIVKKGLQPELFR